MGVGGQIYIQRDKTKCQWDNSRQRLCVTGVIACPQERPDTAWVIGSSPFCTFTFQLYSAKNKETQPMGANGSVNAKTKTMVWG